ncbi:MAG: PhoH family protein [Erysipelotrichaceae bacterium]
MITKINLDELSNNSLPLICGNNDENIKTIEGQLQVSFIINSENILIENENSEKAKEVILAINKCIINQHEFNIREVIYLCQLALNNQKVTLDDLYKKPIVSTYLGKMIYPKTNNQKIFFNAMINNDVVFSIGPAGTGKTYLAVAYAVSLLKKEEIKKIILTRPAVEAGESLGFLPGDLKEKVDPYLRPLYDALNDILGASKVEKYLQSNIIEIAPLAFMRGRTLENSFVILDEAQNTTGAQMKMFLTRLGFNSKMVINGDISQIDLPRNITSGLVESIKVLKSIEEIKIVRLQAVDVVRNPIVQKIIEAYQNK